MKNKYGLMKVLLVLLVFVVAGVIYSCASNKEAEEETGIVQETDQTETPSNESQSANINAGSNENSGDDFSPDSAAGSDSGSDLNEQQVSTNQDANAGKICVHVCGAVQSPGVYYLAKGSRVHVAVEMAGGLKEDAADEYINLAKEAVDGGQIYIPTRAEVDTGAVPESLEDDSQEALEAASADDGKININTASVAELSTLPGIGESKAEAIIAYRENVAEFAATEDIMNVAGIKESSYEKIKDQIKVS